MTIKKPNLSTLVPSQLPEFIREDYTAFTAFVQAYYQFLEENYKVDLLQIRDIDETLEEFVKFFKNEFAKDVPSLLLKDRFLIKHIKDYYLSKGSQISFDVMLSVLFGKSMSVDYPSRQMLRASDGKWNQDVSVFAKINAGDPSMIVGRMVDVITPQRVIRVQVNKTQTVELEVERIRRVVEGIYELYLDRRFFGKVNIGDRMRYADIFDATILPTTAKISINRRGKGFKVGELYNINNGQGQGSVLKISRVDDNGGILAAEFVRYGIGYTTDFTATLLPNGMLSNTTAGATYLTLGGVSPNFTAGFGETTDGFTEIGVINRSDYVVQTAQEIIDEGFGLAWDGTYAGDTVREFYNDSKAPILDPEVPALIKVELGPLTKYPGYYTTNDGFLSDAIFIQDSHYYQAFSYVLKIDERLENYRSVIKTLLHPTGMALFGEYDIRNSFDLSETLECMLKYLVLTFQDNVITTTGEITIYDFSKAIGTHFLNDGVTQDNNSISLSDTTGTNGTRTVPFFGVSKSISTHLLYGGLTSDVNQVTPTDTVGSNGTRTVPFFGVSKAFGSHLLNDNLTTDNNAVVMAESTSNYVSGTRLGAEVFGVSKILNSNSYPHYLFGGVTLDNDNVLPTDTVGTNGTRTVPFFGLDKTFGTHLLNDGVTQDNNAFSLSDTTGTNGTRTVPFFDVSKAFGTHLLNDGVTSDDNTFSLSDTTGTNGTRTVPYFGLSKAFGTHLLNDGVTADNNSVTLTEATINYGYSGLTRLGLGIVNTTKTLDSTLYNHYLNDGTTLDSDTFSMSDTTGVNGARTVPYFGLSKAFGTHLLNDGVTQDVNSVVMADTTGSGSSRTMPFVVLNKLIDATVLNYDGNLDDETVTVTSSGSLWFNPYSDPYPINSSYFLNDGGDYTVGQSAFAG